MLSKLTLDDAGMARCRDCGKLFEARGDSGLCRECLLERGEEVIAAMPVDPEAELREKTERLMQLFTPRKLAQREARQTEGLYSLPKGPLCPRCKKREPLEDSDFCLACHLDLDNALGTASRELLSRVELYEPARKRTRGPSVMDTYGEQAAERGKIAFVPPHSQSPRQI